METLKFLISLCLLTFLLIMIYGFIWRIVRPSMRLIATPIYLAFFVIEGFSNIPFNVPQKGDKRLFMDFLGSLSFLFTLLSVHDLIGIFVQNAKKGTAPTLDDLLPAINTSFPWSLTVIICITVVFIVGHRTKHKDPKITWHDKIDSLKVFKKFVEDPFASD